MTAIAIRTALISIIAAGLILIAAAISAGAAKADPPSIAVTSTGITLGDVVDNPSGHTDPTPVTPVLQTLYNEACTDAVAWATMTYGPLPLSDEDSCPLDELFDGTLGITGGTQMGGLDTIGGQFEYECRLKTICPTYPPQATQEARAAAACFHWILFIPGHVEVNPAIGIVNFETWAWMEGVLADGFENTPLEEPAPIVRNVQLVSDGSVYDPNNAVLLPLPDPFHAAQGLYGGAWLKNSSPLLNGVPTSCTGNQGGNVIDQGGADGANKLGAARLLLGLVYGTTSVVLHPDLVAHTVNSIRADLDLLTRRIARVYVHATSQWDTFFWDFEGDRNDEYTINFWDNGSGDPFTSAGATQARIDAYAPNAISHTYTQAGRYDLQARINFQLISKGGWALIDERYRWIEIWPAQPTTPDSIAAGVSLTSNPPDPNYLCPARDGSICTVSGTPQFHDIADGPLACGQWERDPTPPPPYKRVIPHNCLHWYQPTISVLNGLSTWTWDYTERLTCGGEWAVLPYPDFWDITDINTESGSAQPHNCRKYHYVTVQTSSERQNVFKHVTTQPAFTLYGKFYKSLDSSRSDLDFQEHFGSNYRSSMPDNEVVRYPVRRFWPYLVD